VASGKSVKLKSPFVRCSVVESLFCECELKNFEAFHGRFLKVTQLWIMYSVTSAFSQCGLHSSGVNFETSLVYCPKSNGHTNFPKVWEPPQNSRYQQHDMKKFCYWQSANMLQCKMLLPSQPGAWYLCIPALEIACVRMHTVASLSESCSQTLCLSECQHSKIFLNQVSQQVWPDSSMQICNPWIVQSIDSKHYF